MYHKPCLIRTLWLMVVPVLAASKLFATEPDDPAWRNFQHGLGEPAWIGANADHPQADTAYRPLPASLPGAIDAGKFQLGSDLFHEGRLASANAIACVTCHAGALSGADTRRVSTGVGGAAGTMNALSVLNAAFNFRQFWDGRAVTLADQALLPIQTDVEMANTLEAVLQFLQSESGYVVQFDAVYPDGVTTSNMADAMAHFQQQNFVRFDTPFQRYLAGDQSALEEQALRGWQRFDAVGCAACHNGINLGGNSYQQLGAAIPYYSAAREADSADIGLMSRSGREQDRYVFKVPSLHGVATTQPYFHDGSVENLNTAVELMAIHELGRELDSQDVEDITVFLRSLGSYFNSGISSGATRQVDLDGAGQGAIEDTQSHEDAYLKSIESIEPAYTRLLAEMDRINKGQVAHYDFLQFQHRELIRHARALQHPPSTLDAGTQADLRSVAQHLLSSVTELEWAISDYLRKEAMTRVYLAGREAPGQLSENLGNIEDRLAETRQSSTLAMQAITATDPRPLSSELQRLYPLD